MEYRLLKSEESISSVFIMYPFTFYIFITGLVIALFSWKYFQINSMEINGK